MKKSIACLVAIGIVLFSSGCNRNSSDSSSASAAPVSSSSSETTASQSDATSDTSSETTESETSESSEVIDTSKSLVKHDLEYLPLHIVTTDRLYFGNPVERVLHDEFVHEETYKATFYPKIFLYEDLLTFDDSRYSALQGKIDHLLLPGLERLEEEHDNLVSSYKGGNDPCPKRESADYMGTRKIKLFRSDTQILSFRVDTSYADTEQFTDEFTFDTYSFDSQTAAPILLDDVVKDKEALISLVEKSVGIEELRNHFSPESITEEIRDGSIRFGLTYDGICLIPSVEYHGGVMLKVSAFAHPEVFNMDYFGHTPENYSLFTFSVQTAPEEISMMPDMERDLDQGLFWDFDEDGELDTLSVSRDAQKSRITILGKTRSFDDTYNFLTYMQTQDGRYLFADPYAYEVSCFAVQKDGTLKDVPSEIPFHPIQRFLVDPDQFENETQEIFLSCSFWMGQEAKISSGAVSFTENTYYNQTTSRLKIDLPAKKYDIITQTVGEDITLKKDSYLVLDVFYEEEENSKIIGRVYEQDSEEFEYVALLSNDGLFSVSGYDFSQIVELYS